MQFGNRDDIIQLTPLWTGERFEDGVGQVGEVRGHGDGTFPQDAHLLQQSLRLGGGLHERSRPSQIAAHMRWVGSTICVRAESRMHSRRVPTAAVARARSASLGSAMIQSPNRGMCRNAWPLQKACFMNVLHKK